MNLYKENKLIKRKVRLDIIRGMNFVTLMRIKLVGVRFLPGSAFSYN